MINSRLGLFTAAANRSKSKSYHRRRHPFFRSYGAILPSSLTTVLPIASVCSTRLPVSVLVRAPVALTARFFLEAWARHLRARHFVSHLGLNEVRTSLHFSLPAFTGASRTPRVYPSPSPLGSKLHRRYRNICLLCIDYAFRPRLSSRLTLGGLALPRKPWIYGGDVFHVSLVTHASIRTSMQSTDGYPLCFNPHGTLPYHC